MTLALVVPGPLDRRSGGYSYDVDLVAHLEGLGHRVDVWSLGPPPAARDQLARWLSGPGPDVVVFDALVHGPLGDVFEHLRPQSRSVWVGLVHHLAWLDPPHPGWSAGLRRRREARFLATMDARLFNSDDTRRTVHDLGLAPRPELVCRPPWTPGPLSPGPSDQSRLLFVGNLLPRKNLHGLLRALGRLPAGLGWSLTVAGSPDLDPGYARRCRRLAAPLGEQVVFEGRVSGPRLDELWTTADLFALPSFHEGWGMAHAEALGRGVVSLAVPRGGVVEVLADTALWSEADPGSLARALGRYLTEADLRHDLAARTRARRAAFVPTGFTDLGPFLASLVR